MFFCWIFLFRSYVAQICSVNWETEQYNSVLEITVSGNTEMGTRHLYWILSALHLQCTKVQGLELMVHEFRASFQHW